MSTNRALLTIMLLGSLLTVAVVGGCPNAAIENASASGPTMATANGLDVIFDADSGAALVASVTDPNSAMNLMLFADAANGVITSLAGTTAEGDTFEATFSETAPTGFTVAGIQFTIDQIDEYTYEVTQVSSESARGVGQARQPGEPLLRVTVSTAFQNAGRTVFEQYAKCFNSLLCPTPQLKKLHTLLNIALLEIIADHLFNERCLDTEIFGPDRCRQLLGTIAAFGQAADAFIAANPDLPPEVRVLCFRLADDCDTLVYAPQSPDFSNTNTDPPLPTVTVTIAGPSEIQYGAQAGYTASASGASVDFTWDLLESSVATLVNTAGQATTVQAGSTPGTATLVVEARMPDTGAVVASASHTISITAPPAPVNDYVVWYDPENNCWDAPTIKVTSRSSFEQETGGIEMQGGFASREDGEAWVCEQVEARIQHAWCGSQQRIAGQWYKVPYYWNCDYTGIPWVN